MVLTNEIFPDNDWSGFFYRESQRDYFLNLNRFLTNEYEEKNIFPPPEDIFNAYRYSPFEETKAVILGQDPYHNDGQACGLAFSVNPGIKIPPSLNNIFKELERDMGTRSINNGWLKPWAQQGVLLLNTILTVRKGEAGSHGKKGWEVFTDETIRSLSEKGGVVFMLWGNSAREKETIIDKSKNMVLISSHPSPLSASRGFHGCGHFSVTNELLRKYGKKEIIW